MANLSQNLEEAEGFPLSLSKTVSLGEKRGLLFERDFFGVDSENIRDIPFSRIRNLSFKSLKNFCTISFQRTVYGLDPSKPKTFLSGLLFEGIKDSLPEKMRDRLRMYCLLGTPADRLGADGVIKLGDKRVLIDLTTNPRKNVSGDILLLKHYIFSKFLRNRPNPIYLTNFIQQVVDILHPR